MTELAIRDEGHYLATVRDVRDLAERIEHVEDAKALADRAALAGMWARRAKLGEEQVNLANIARLWAERRAGELLLEVPRERGFAHSAHAEPNAVTPYQQTLEDAGISAPTAKRMQQLADIPAADFEQAVEKAAENGQVTASAVRRLVVPLNEDLIERQQREAHIRHLNSCLRGLEVSPEYARSEMTSLIEGGYEHAFTPARFEKAAQAALAYAETLREAGTE